MLDFMARLDIETLMIVLFLGNLVSVALVVLYLATGARDRRIGLYYLPAKIFQMLAYLLFASRGQISDFMSLNVGNGLFMAGFYLEVFTMMSVAHESRRLFYPITIILAACLVVFSIAEYYRGDASLRIAVSSLCVFAIFSIPNLRLLASKNTSIFTRCVGLFYLFFLIMLLPRAYTALTGSTDRLVNSITQLLAFLSLILLLIFSLPAYLLLMKEQADSVINVMATTDYLTGLSNRYRFLDAAERAFERCRFGGDSVAVVFFDIDYFKSINDTYGHAFGDTVLMVLGRIVIDSVRPTDLCCRYGGEEFVIFLPEATKLIAVKVAERIRSAIAAESFSEHPDFHFTISVGVMDGIPQPGDSLDLFVGQADAAMYSAKKSGRDQIIEYDPVFNFMIEAR